MTDVNKYIKSARRSNGLGFPLSAFPKQKLASSEKGEEWGKDCVDGIIAKSFANGNVLRTGRTSRHRKQINYNLVNSIFDENDFDYILDPYNMGWEGSLPTKLQDFNIIKPKIELLKGEELKRPFNFMVVGMCGEVINVRNQYKEKLFKESFDQYLNSLLAESGLAEPEVDENGEPLPPKTPKQIEDIMNSSYQDVREKYANDILQFLVPYLKLESKFNKGWEHALISGEEIYYIGINNNEPACRNVNPLNFDYDKTQDLENIEDAQWCYEERYMSSSEIIDEYGEYLTDSDIEMLDNNEVGIPMGNTGPLPGFAYSSADMAAYNYNSTGSNILHIRVATVCWKSLKKIGFLSYLDENGIEQEKIVPETFKLTPELKANGAKIEYRWINEVWKGTKIGSDIYVDIEPLPNQIRNLDNIGECKLPYVGKIFNALNSRSTSVVDLLKPHQYTYTIVWYRLLNELAKAKGKKMVMDIAQIPKSQGIDLEKWMYYFDNLGIAFINSFEEGKEGDPDSVSKFNQFQAIDMTLSNTVGTYIDIINKLEDMAGEICGVSRQRQGQVFASETQGGVERSVIQSSMITESFFYKHNEIKQAVLTRLVEVSKLAYTKGKKLQYIIDDGYKVFLDIDAEDVGLLQDSEFGVFVSNSNRDFRIKEKLEMMAQAALQNDQIKFTDLITIMKSNSTAEIGNKLEAGQQEKIARDQQQIEQQQIHEKELKEAEISWAREQMDREDVQRQLDRENDLRKIEIQSLKGLENPDVNNNGIVDITERAKINIEQTRLQAETIQKDKELALKAQEIAIKAKTEMMKAENQLKIAKENKNKFDKSKPKKK